MLHTLKDTELLARCHGYEVFANDRLVGVVQTPVFSGTSIEPDSLILRIGGSTVQMFTTIRVDAVETIEPDRQLIVIHGRT